MKHLVPKFVILNKPREIFMQLTMHEMLNLLNSLSVFYLPQQRDALFNFQIHHRNIIISTYVRKPSIYLLIIRTHVVLISIYVAKVPFLYFDYASRYDALMQ